MNIASVEKGLKPNAKIFSLRFVDWVAIYKI
jgi:hypothetical protein